MGKTTALPQHVRDWKHVYNHPDLQHRSDHTLEDACDRLTSEWLAMDCRWRTLVKGQVVEGKLITVYSQAYLDGEWFSPAFEIEVPVEGDYPIYVKAHFARFEPVR